MDTLEQSNRKRRGQTLAEFAITMPILLLLLFGIIEFGRIFQAWVTLQNAARTAARYASTGQFDENRYPLDVIVPCVDTDERGTQTVYDPNNTPGDTSDDINIYQGGQESVFATWYGGLDCEPGNDNHQQMRRDLARILSITDEARRGAAGLAICTQQDGPACPSYIPNPPFGSAPSDQPWYTVWQRPLPGSDTPSWFNVVICSSRPKTDDSNGSVFADEFGRYSAKLNPGEHTYAPVCILNEQDGSGNAGKPWLDAGGPGDSVTIVVQFNHPLITPLGIAPYLPLEARRTAVNESFRSARAVAALGGAPLGGGGVNTPTPSDTPSPTNTPTSTFTPSPSPSASPSPTITPTLPFTCSLITVSNISFFSNQVFVEIQNDNSQSTQLTRVILNWSKPASYPNMYLAQMALDNNVHWQGNDSNPPTDTLDTVGDPGWIASADRTVFGSSQSVWQGVFGNGPSSLGSVMSPFDFSGSKWYFSNPSGGPDCEKQLTYTGSQPTNTPNPNITNTPTFTPDCASANVSVRFDRFQTFGVVRLLVTNNRNVVAPMTGFSVVWIKRSAVMTLEQITVGGSSPADPLTTRVWQAPAGQDANPPTNSTEPTYLVDYVFPPNSTTPLYLDFGGTSTTLQTAFGVTPSDFNGSWFAIGCDIPSGGLPGNGSGGSSSSGRIFLASEPTPPPTNTPGPTNTPSQTFTPSKTFTPAPPTNTPLPTNTSSPTNTPPPSPTPTPTTPPPPPTQEGSGCVDGGC